MSYLVVGTTCGSQWLALFQQRVVGAEFRFSARAHGPGWAGLGP